MTQTNKDNFTQKTVSKVAERAGYICSNPSCRRVTIGPDNASTEKSIKTGEAAHICAAAPGGPRYDMSQSASDRKSINNALWLCSTCADLIDKNGGSSYPAEHLRKWKRDHEALMKECLEGGKRVIFQFIPSRKDALIAKRIVYLLEDKGALFAPYDQENPIYVTDSLKELRTSLTAMRAEIAPESPLSIVVDSIVTACRHYMNTTSNTPDFSELNYSLGAVRKVVGINVGDIIKHYDVKISESLASIIPS